MFRYTPVHTMPEGLVPYARHPYDLERGEGYPFMPWKDVEAVYQWVAIDGKPYTTFPKLKLSREDVAMVLAHYAQMEA